MLVIFSNSQNIKFNIALKQNNVELLPNMVDSISNPDSPNYGEYLNYEQINNLIEPNKYEKEKVIKWLNNNNLIIKKDYIDAIKVEGDIEKVSNLFDINIIRQENELKIEGDYKVPNKLKNIIEFIEGLSNKNYNRKKTIKTNILNENVDPGYVGREVLEKLYNFDFNVSNVSIGLIEYSGSEGFSQDDLKTSEIMNSEQNKILSKNHIVGNIYGSDTESQLDVQAASIISNGADLWYWKVDSWLYSFAVDFFNTKNVPDVISMSWGWAERDQCSITTCNNITSSQYVNRVNVEYMKLALRGITITVASGDAGAPGRTNENCDSENPINPVFPGSSPWVTSVGATVIMKNKLLGLTQSKTLLCSIYTCAKGNEEHSIWYNLTGWTAGGGFGIYSTEGIPEWQKNDVLNYLNNAKLPPSKNFNRNGRGYPDVAAIGHNCPVFTDNNLMGVDGTSCSSPYFAGIISLLNNHQEKRGKPKIGFANHLLYKMSKDGVFNDITKGYNWCTEYNCCPNNSDGSSNFGFTSGKGWDPVSGLGTPNVNKMISWLDKNM